MGQWGEPHRTGIVNPAQDAGAAVSTVWLTSM